MRQLLAQLKIIQRQKAKKKEAKDKKAASRMAKQVREDGGSVSVWKGIHLFTTERCVHQLFSLNCVSPIPCSPIH